MSTYGVFLGLNCLGNAPVFYEGSGTYGYFTNERLEIYDTK